MIDSIRAIMKEAKGPTGKTWFCLEDNDDLTIRWFPAGRERPLAGDVFFDVTIARRETMCRDVGKHAKDMLVDQLNKRIAACNALNPSHKDQP